MTLVRASSQNIRTCGMVLRIFVDPYPLDFAMSGNCGNFANDLVGGTKCNLSNFRFIAFTLPGKKLLYGTLPVQFSQ